MRRNIATDLSACIGFFTRLPVRWTPQESRSFADALWAAPVAGVLVGALGAGVFWISVRLLALPPEAAALLALTATMLATGCLHEDGLADAADGFGGGATRERKLEIMKDSRIGTFGVAALFVSLALRWTALNSVASPSGAFAGLIAAHGASRAFLPAFLRIVPPARSNGLGAGVGHVHARTAIAALLIGAIPLSLIGSGMALVAAIALSFWFFGLKRLCERQIGGQTGDVCGALQQGAEVIVLLAAARSFP